MESSVTNAPQAQAPPINLSVVIGDNSDHEDKDGNAGMIENETLTSSEEASVAVVQERGILPPCHSRARISCSVTTEQIDSIESAEYWKQLKYLYAQKELLETRLCRLEARLAHESALVKAIPGNGNESGVEAEQITASSERKSNRQASPSRTTSSYSIHVIHGPIPTSKFSNSSQNLELESDIHTTLSSTGTNVNQEQLKVSQFKSCPGCVSRFKPCFLADGTQRCSAMLVNPMIGFPVTWLQPSVRVEISKSDHEPCLPRLVHFRHSVPSLYQPEPWAYFVQEQERIANMTSTSTLSQTSGPSDNEQDLNSSPSWSTIDEENEDEEAVNFSENPLELASSAEIQVSPEDSFATPCCADLNDIVLSIHTNMPERPRSPVARMFEDSESLEDYSRGNRHAFIMSTRLNNALQELDLTERRHSQPFYRVDPRVLGEDMEDFSLVTDASDQYLRNGGNSFPQTDGDVARTQTTLAWLEADDEGSMEFSLNSSSSSVIEDVSSSSSESSDPGNGMDALDLFNEAMMGEGDADGSFEPSSQVSLASDFGQGPAGPTNWTFPTSTLMGGQKYSFLETRERPRAFAGHKFVVSVFGAKTRQNVESRLPWMPTYADRIQCILNQYIGAMAQESKCSESTQTTSKSEFLPHSKSTTEEEDANANLSEEVPNGMPSSHETWLLKKSSRETEPNSVYVKAYVALDFRNGKLDGEPDAVPPLNLSPLYKIEAVNQDVASRSEMKPLHASQPIPIDDAARHGQKKHKRHKQRSIFKRICCAGCGKSEVQLTPTPNSQR